ncbi:DNA polymerase III subunit delta' [Vibrio cincinnatiensis]|uniref:DNA polymerase III subunit delta' n=1 Tax=Vibrio cincinnatiensis TaxID=675 RepID=UPI001EDDC574|nr:DNA polymerase III subunit delta' [Vibrio cincinnatiensis]MCG3731689.1 DNA polymerase III subunit delta' [Vibrio cincinnatiensis]MCG3738327.1 DNA polymerase III subunit delta' [Vibrio cincinnatiensis]MCG3744400.1 DNA polymerase III subunit delta' [Vibrio cincinnatiensis]MCG3758970.1 DNA polymerase III subunit delta' [Vibrio cincinnatiensis]MCG3762589.1 DNA polymerase III subunit delta' [Vibrio cincinnatiensis]
MNSLYPWLTPAWIVWKTQLDHARFASATLISAPEGCGSFQLVERFAQALMCTHDSSEPCGFCHGCELMRSESHPDYHLIRPEKAGKNITVDQIRYANRLAQESSQLSGFRLIVIEPAEAMNESAANALLKTLEEPAEKCIFVLLTVNINQLLSTIVSRCQKIVVPEPTPQVVNEWLALECRDPIPDYAAHICSHSPLVTKEAMASGDIKHYLEIETLFLSALQGDLSSLLACSQWLSAKPLTYLKWIWFLLTDAQKVTFGIMDSYFTPGSQSVSTTISLALLQQQAESLVKLIEQLRLFSGLNAELLITDWLLKFNEDSCL